MTSITFPCPLCQAAAHASDIDIGNRARIYCQKCSRFDVTKRVFDWLKESSSERRAHLSRMAKAAPPGKILILTYKEQVNANYEEWVSKEDRPAPEWLTANT